RSNLHFALFTAERWDLRYLRNVTSDLSSRARRCLKWKTCPDPLPECPIKHQASCRRPGWRISEVYLQMGALFAGETAPSQFVRSSSDGLRSSVRSKSGGRRVVTAGNKLSHFVGITKLWDHLHENGLCARFLYYLTYTF